MGQSIVSIQNSLSAGELSPSLYGRTDLEKYHSGCTTSRNFFSNYRGGIASRAGLAYVGMCKQQYPNPPPRDIPFQFSINQGYALEFGHLYMRIKANGAYVTEQAISVTSVSSVGLFTTLTSHGYSVGDWVFDTGNIGFNGLTWIIASTPSGTTFTVTDLFGTPVTAATASGTGTVARIYTIVSPFQQGDLQWIKYTQSADTLSLTCLNQDTGASYQPYDLVRQGNTNWVFNPVITVASISAPTGVAATATSSTTVDTWYSYVVTAVSSSGEESVASSLVEIQNNDIALAQGSNTLTWTPVPGAQYYNVYGAVPSYSTPVPYASSFGFMGRALGPQFVDTNIVPDFTQTPPIHANPFAGGQIINVIITNGGTGYSQNTVGSTITTSTGSGFVGIPIVVSGAVIGFYIQNPGMNYAAGDTIALTGGTGATASLSVGPATGNYPSVPAYYQSRRVYAATPNQPDTYWMSKPGLFKNFDMSIPTNDGDSLVGTPWAQQVNGIQFLVPMPGGLVVLTGNGAWQVNGGSQAAITPSSQTATPQAYNGCNPRVQPLTVNYDILYVQSKGATVRDLAYNFFVNIYTGTDLTVLSNHLFTDYQIVQWSWCEEPYKLVWVVRNDGALLSLTYVKEQDVYSWSRHDTNGLFLGVCSITEPPVDAAYFITQRFIRGAWRYYSERMDNRIWNNVEDSFCVDAGLTNPRTFPNTTITASAVTGSGVSFTTSGPTFGPGDVGSIIRMGGGVATITAYNNSTQVTGTFTQDISLVAQDTSQVRSLPQPPGKWSVSVPITTVSGLNHLEGLTVTGLADGSVIPPVVVTNGQIVLQEPASQIVVGLGYTCQGQTMYIDHPTREGNTVQNRRKNIQSVGVRVEASRGLQIGSDQPDAAAQQFYAPTVWTNMSEIKERTNMVNAGNAVPLYTGDYYKNIDSQWDVRGQVAVQQVYPLPANVLSVISYWDMGDDQG